MPEEIWFYLTIILGITTVALIVFFLIEWERKKYSEAKQMGGTITAEKFISTSRSFPEEVLREVKDRLRVLDLEREILSYAIRRLYEAQAEGKITPEERDALTKKYREDLERVKEEIACGETIIALNELERMREEFIKMFSEKIEIIDKRIEELKAIVSLKPREQTAKPLSEEARVEDIEKQMPAREEIAEKQPIQRRRREAIKPKAAEGEVKEESEKAGEGDEVDKSIEKIVTEIEKVLSRLSQIEVEE